MRCKPKLEAKVLTVNSLIGFTVLFQMCPVENSNKGISAKCWLQPKRPLTWRRQWSPKKFLFWFDRRWNLAQLQWEFLSRIFILRKYNWDFKNIADMKNLKHKKMMEIINAEGQWSAGGRIKSEAPTKGSSQNKFSVKVGNLAQPAWPPPLPVCWDSQKGKKK